MVLSKKAIKRNLKKIEWMDEYTDTTLNKYTRIVYIICEEYSIKRYSEFIKIITTKQQDIAATIYKHIGGSEQIRSLERVRKLAMEYKPTSADLWHEILNKARKDNPEAIRINLGRNLDKIKRIRSITIDDIKHQLDIDSDKLNMAVSKASNLILNSWNQPREVLTDWQLLMRNTIRRNVKLPGRDTPLEDKYLISQLHGVIRAAQTLFIHRLQIENEYWVCRAQEFKRLTWLRTIKSQQLDINSWNYIDFKNREFVINKYKTRAIYGPKRIKLGETTLLLAQFLHRFPECCPLFTIQIKRTKMSYNDRMSNDVKPQSKSAVILRLFKNNEHNLSPTEVRKIWITSQRAANDPMLLKDGVHGNSIRIKEFNYILI